MAITTSVETLDGSWIYCYIGCLLGRASRTKETLLYFYENMDLGKWDTTMWYRVARNPLVFHRLTVGQRIPGFWGVTASPMSSMSNLEFNMFLVDAVILSSLPTMSHLRTSIQ